jgi:hypothetical protein
MRRRIMIWGAVAAGVAAVLLAVLPFAGSTSWDGPAWSDRPVLAKASFDGRCRPAIITAWRKPGPDDALWAVTVETNMSGDTQGYLGRWCANDARRRLLSSLGLGAVAVGVGIIGRRMQPRSVIGTQGPPA